MLELGEGGLLVKLGYTEVVCAETLVVHLALGVDGDGLGVSDGERLEGLWYFDMEELLLDGQVGVELEDLLDLEPGEDFFGLAGELVVGGVDKFPFVPALELLLDLESHLVDLVHSLGDCPLPIFDLVLPEQDLQLDVSHGGVEHLLDLLQELVSLVPDLLLRLDFVSLQLKRGLPQHVHCPPELLLFQAQLIDQCLCLRLLPLERQLYLWV